VESQEWEQFESELKEQLSVFIRSSKNREKRRDVLDSMQKALADTLKQSNELDTFAHILSRLLEKFETFDKKEVTIIQMFNFLWTYETHYVLWVDIFCCLLVGNGHDLSFRGKYVSSFEEIGNVDVHTKLKFLEAHNFKIFNRKQDRKLRNKIAHHDFLLYDSGILQVKGETIDINQRLSDLVDFTTKVMKTFNECSIKF
jgi:hypothetical protein